MNRNPPVSGLRRCQPPLARGPYPAGGRGFFDKLGKGDFLNSREGRKKPPGLLGSGGLSETGGYSRFNLFSRIQHTAARKRAAVISMMALAASMEP